MKARSTEKLNTYEAEGMNLIIYWNEEFNESEAGSEFGEEALEGSSSYWSYDYCRAFTTDTYGILIEKIMATRYPTYGSEIAALANGGESKSKHEAFRDLAKSLASGWVNRNVALEATEVVEEDFN